MCATGSPCGCTASSSDGGTLAALAAAVVVTGSAVAFIAAHLLLLAAGAVAVAAGTLGIVLWLRRFMIPEGRARLAHPAARRPSQAAVTARPVRALPARPRRAIGAPRQRPHGSITGHVVQSATGRRGGDPR